MAYHPRIETSEMASFITTRSRNSELWFVNNPRLEQAILAYAARFTNRYDVELYALAIEGNHTQMPASFPKANRSEFMRDFNSSVAKAVPRLCPEYTGGKLWARRYSVEYMPAPEDIEDRFFYTVLQPVQDGLVEKISDYPGYNCFSDAVKGVSRKFKFVRWGEYNAAKRFNPKVKIKDYTDIVKLKYSRLPGYEDMSQREYSKLMHEKLEKRRLEVVERRKREGLGFAGREVLRRAKPGSIPENTKTSTQNSHRPRVLCICPIRRREALEWYFAIYEQYKEASRRYRAGELDVEFPPGTFRPYSKPGAPP